MVRSAAKNFESVAVVTSPDQYAMVLEQLEAGGGKLDRATRYALVGGRLQPRGAVRRRHQQLPVVRGRPRVSARRFRSRRTSASSRSPTCVTGRTPISRQPGIATCTPAAGSLATARQHQGKELSYNNIADADAAWECVRQFDQTACAIIKHANPCGVAVAESPDEAYDLAFATDPTSAFGGIIAFNRPLDAATAAAIVERQFLEVLIAPAYDDDTLAVLAAKKNVRVLQIDGGESDAATGIQARRQRAAGADLRPAPHRTGRLPRRVHGANPPSRSGPT